MYFQTKIFLEQIWVRKKTLKFNYWTLHYIKKKKKKCMTKLKSLHDPITLSMSSSPILGNSFCS